MVKINESIHKLVENRFNLKRFNLKIYFKNNSRFVIVGALNTFGQQIP